jgi:hypothetical protein
MNRRKALTASLLLGAVPALAVRAAVNPEQADSLARLSKERLDAARKTYEVKWKNYREGIRVGADTLYLWSLRWLEAEKLVGEHPDKVAACQGHVKRMRDLDRLIRDIDRAGQATIDEVTAVTFYRSEAEVLLIQARGERKEP